MENEKYIVQLFEEIKRDIVESANKKNKNLNNKIPESIHWEVERNDKIIYSMYAWRWIVEAWETGRGITKNKKKSKVTLREKLVQWILDVKLRTEKKEAEGLSYYIAKNIHTKGTKDFPTKTGVLTDNLTESNINKFFRNIKENIINSYKIEI